MRILLVHDFYQQFGGTDAVAIAEKQLLESRGHDLRVYTRHNNEIRAFDALEKARFAVNTIYSFRTTRDMGAALAAWKPDVAYIHNIYPLISPSIYHWLYSRGIPTVQCMHDFRPLCPNGLFYTHGEICERCKAGNYLHAIRQRCYKDSYAFSALYATSLGVNRLAKMMDKVGAFVCLTEFHKQKLLEVKVPAEKLYVRPNWIDASTIGPASELATCNYAVYLGRLSPEKGLWTLVRAFERARQIRLKIIGEGPLEGELRRYCSEKGLGNVEILGFKVGEEKWQLLKGALFAVIPSECYENFPVVALEYYACAKPILASNLGGLPCIIADRQTGLLFQPGNATELADKICYLFANPEEAKSMGRRGRELAETRYGPEESYRNIMNVFQAVQAVRATESTQ